MFELMQELEGQAIDNSKEGVYLQKVLREWTYLEDYIHSLEELALSVMPEECLEEMQRDAGV
ncbi:hypothetical protein QE321_gp029 [Pseudomonas phage SPA01]|uniref:Uncharacterized protein n=2 Tax=Pakpunavirus TaxID=1921407 RepID=A0AAF0ILW8_9CAUD|nr:hypothetical protein QE321_gp029 [Pseudomonas phage SPA01]YP_010762132.1 hypothetical protein QE323_gp170 [Pseudomonas phage SPA05]WEY17793.1 hypothetical protein OJIADAOI_00022 [Pseudomonas phage SPA05]WFG74085.1 hypothetical protein DOEKDBNA_00029 [Pseudomonas phage SPA01]